MFENDMKNGFYRLLYHVIIFFFTDRSIDRFIYSSIYLFKIFGFVYCLIVCLRLNVPVNKFQSFWDGLLGLTLLSNDDKCRAQGNNIALNERIEPATLRPRVRQRVVCTIINAVIFKTRFTS